MSLNPRHIHHSKLVSNFSTQIFLHTPLWKHDNVVSYSFFIFVWLLGWLWVALKTVVPSVAPLNLHLHLLFTFIAAHLSLSAHKRLPPTPRLPSTQLKWNSFRDRRWIFFTFICGLLNFNYACPSITSADSRTVRPPFVIEFYQSVWSYAFILYALWTPLKGPRNHYYVFSFIVHLPIV